MKCKTLTALFLLLAFACHAGATDDDRLLDFVQNKHQFPQQVLFKADLPGGAVFLTAEGYTYSYYSESDLARIHELKHQGVPVENEMVHRHAYRVSFVESNKNSTVSQEELRPYYHNYFLGNDPGNWAGRVPVYGKITRHNIYEQVDAVTYSKGLSLKYDLVVKPGGDPSRIVMQYSGVHPVVDKEGSLVLQTSVNKIEELAPYAYQLIDGREVAVVCRFRELGNDRVAFELPAGYNKSIPLVIDPLLVFSTFSGATVSTFGFSATYDHPGALYAGGECFGTGWPFSLGAFQTTFGGSTDAGINKYSANGSTRVYSTYYGGNSVDLPNNMIVNNRGELVICGSTSSDNLPVTSGCYDNSYNGMTDIYVARFSADGSQLKAATYLGGSSADGSNLTTLSPNYGDDHRGEVLTASNGNIFVAGSSSSINFPVTSGALQPVNAGSQDAVICELDSNLTTLIYSTYLGGTSDDAAFSLVLNSSNEVVVCGGTKSSNFPASSNAYKPVAPGGTDGFVSIISTTSGLVHSTYLGTASYDHAFKIQIDESDNIFVLGQTEISSVYPVSAGVFSVPSGDIFIHKLNPTLTASLASTRMGNTGITKFVPTAFMHDICGNTYFSGFQASANSPLTTNAYQSTAGSFWLGALSPDFTTLLYGTFFGPAGTHVDGGTSRFDPAGIIYHSACTADASFPTTAGVVAPLKLSPSWDVASYKFDMEVGGVHAAFELANNANDTGCADYHVLFNNLSTGATTYRWYFGNGDSSTVMNPDHTFPEGVYTVTLIATRATGCRLVDTATLELYVKPKNQPELLLRDTFTCDPGIITLGAPVSNPSSAFAFHWEPVSAVTSNPNQQWVTVNTSLSNDFTVYVSNSTIGECVDSALGTIHITVNDYSNMVALPADTLICPGDTVSLRAYGGSRIAWSPDRYLENAASPLTGSWPPSDIDYIVTITNDSGCAIGRTVHIRVIPPPALNAGIDQDIKRGESAQLLAHAEGAFYWLPAGAVVPGDVLNPVVRPDTTTTYYLYANEPSGCNAMDSVTIHVTNAMLPNAFSPNGDGANDQFRLMIQDERVRLKDFSVYNRYGQRVFFTKNVEEGWDGFFNAKPADVGVYYYYVNYTIGVKTYNLKGDVTLIR